MPEDEKTPYIEAVSMAPVPEPVESKKEKEADNPFTPAGFLKRYDPSPAPRPVDDAFPKSSHLYQKLCDEFGPHNVSPLPMWLVDASDRERVQWYKFGSNAYVYFLHKTPKYRKTVQKLVNTPLCCFCCCYGNYIKTDSFYGRRVAKQSRLAWCEELLYLIFCPCIYPCTFDHEQTIQFLYPQGGRPWPRDPSCGCFSLSQFGPLRRDFYATLQAAGIKTADPCCPCLVTTCCSPCVASQYTVILQYYAMKRIGLESRNQFRGTAMPPYAQKFVDYAFIANRVKHPQYNGFYAANLFSSGALREDQLIIGGYMEQVFKFGAFAEWIDPQKALEAHNTKWRNFKSLTLPFPGCYMNFATAAAQEVVMD